VWHNSIRMPLYLGIDGGGTKTSFAVADDDYILARVTEGGSSPTRIPGEVRSSGDNAHSSLDIGQLLDDGPWTVLQKIVVFIAALSIIMDGFDGQLIGFAVPVLIKEWGVTRGDFAPALAAG